MKWGRIKDVKVVTESQREKSRVVQSRIKSSVSVRCSSIQFPAPRTRYEDYASLAEGGSTRAAVDPENRCRQRKRDHRPRPRPAARALGREGSGGLEIAEADVEVDVTSTPSNEFIDSRILNRYNQGGWNVCTKGNK